MYLYETHCHTAEGSKCASCSGAELAKFYAEKGYQGIVVTDHFYGGNTAVDKQLPWEQWVEQFMKGYEAAKAAGASLGLQVFFGWEYNDRGTEFLTYGLGKEWLLAHPEVADIAPDKYCELIRREGGILIHAHPFRQRGYIRMIRLIPQLTDGVEVVNKCNEPKANYLADQYADNFNLMKVGGTDFHKKDHLAILGGVALPTMARNVLDIFEAARNGKIRIL